MYEYKVNILKVVDGDTVDVDIDLGFGCWLRNERVRIVGIDCPESRTSDRIEKVFGEAAKQRLTSLLSSEATLISQISKMGENMKGKFGRILGDFTVYHAPTDSWRMVTDIMVEEGHAVAYFGGSKEEIQQKHMANRGKLIREGLVKMTEEEAGLV